MSDDAKDAKIETVQLARDTLVGDHLHTLHGHEDGTVHVVNTRRIDESSQGMRIGEGVPMDEDGKVIRVGDEVISTDGSVVTEVIKLRGADGPAMVNSRAYRNNYDQVFGKKTATN